MAQNQTQDKTFKILDLCLKTNNLYLYNPKMIYFRLSALKSSTACILKLPVTDFKIAE